MLTFRAKGGFRQMERRITRNVLKVQRRAVVAVGKDIAAEIRAIVMRLSGASQAAVNKAMKLSAPRPSDRVPVYRIRIRRAVPLAKIGKTKRKFTPSKRGSAIGTLEIVELSGETATFHGVRRVGKGRGARYVLPKSGKLPARTAGGLRVRVDSTGDIQDLKKIIRPRLKKAIRREYRRLRRA